MRRVPPERFHVFVSYTTREDEVRLVKPMVDEFLNTVLGPLIRDRLGEVPVFYDGHTLSQAEDSWRWVLERVLRFAVEESEVLLALVSPSFASSGWCLFECGSMHAKRRRPWFDICRTPPIEELRDRRRADRRPGRWYSLRARWMRWQDRMSAALLWLMHREVTRRRGGHIVSIVWKGGLESGRGISALADSPAFDWTDCARAFELSMHVTSHLLRHGSVSPAKVEEAAKAGRASQEAMTKTALAVIDILARRRHEYRAERRSVFVVRPRRRPSSG